MDGIFAEVLENGIRGFEESLEGGLRNCWLVK